MPNLLAYWSNPTDALNKPQEYAKYTKRSDFLLSFFPKYVKPVDTVLELGCNCGRNLNALYQAGYINLYGIDINTSALMYGATIYPDLFKVGTLFNESIESWIKNNPKQYDCIFTMAVLEHIPRESEWVFTNIATKAVKIIITIEDERSGSPRHFPRNYGDIFNRLGWKQVYIKQATKADELEGITARIFERR